MSIYFFHNFSNLFRFFLDFILFLSYNVLIKYTPPQKAQGANCFLRHNILEWRIFIMTSIGNILADARRKKHLSQAEVAAKLDALGIHKSYKSISAWEKGLAEPNCTTLMALSKILGITDIYDRYYGDTPEHPYTLLNDEGRAKADEYIELLVASGRYARHRAEALRLPAREVRLFHLPASAGPGEFLEAGDGFDLVCLPPDAPKDTDFMIKIQISYM